MHIACNSVFAVDAVVENQYFQSTFYYMHIACNSVFAVDSCGKPFLLYTLWKTVYINTSYILNFILFEKIIILKNSVFAADTIVKTICISTTYMQNFILFENNYHFKRYWCTEYFQSTFFSYILICIVPVSLL
nr:unnamed protein product [Callosobruchus analis]